MEREYRLLIEYADNGTYLATLRRVNAARIDHARYPVAEFESRSLSTAIQKAAEWIKTDFATPANGANIDADDDLDDAPIGGWEKST